MQAVQLQRAVDALPHVGAGILEAEMDAAAAQRRGADAVGPIVGAHQFAGLHGVIPVIDRCAQLGKSGFRGGEGCADGDQGLFVSVKRVIGLPGRLNGRAAFLGNGADGVDEGHDVLHSGLIHQAFRRAGLDEGQVFEGVFRHAVAAEADGAVFHQGEVVSGFGDFFPVDVDGQLGGLGDDFEPIVLVGLQLLGADAEERIAAVVFA